MEEGQLGGWSYRTGRNPERDELHDPDTAVLAGGSRVRPRCGDDAVLGEIAKISVARRKAGPLGDGDIGCASGEEKVIGLRGRHGSAAHGRGRADIRRGDVDGRRGGEAGVLVQVRDSERADPRAKGRLN